MTVDAKHFFWGRFVHSFCVVLALCFLLLYGTYGYSQADQGTITGVVKDTAGAAIPNAQVNLTNTDTNLALQAQSNGSGIFIFSPIKIGNYELSVTAPGFSTVTQQHLQLNVQQRLNVPVTLNLGSVRQTVTVNTAPPLLQTQDAALGQVVSTRTINNTPLAGRNWVYIAQLTAGIEPGNGSRGSGEGDFSANGQREEQNDFILDGVDNNTDTEDFLNGASYVVRPPPDALSEFKVQTSDYSAEFGHSAGAVINATVKSGTNQVHGDFWEYFRNDALNARDYFATTVPEYRENQFGGTLGFPIVRNKLFFFGDTEANRIVQGSPVTISVPTALERQGNFSELLNGSINGNGNPIKLYQPGSAGGTPQGSAVLSCNGQVNVFCPGQMSQVALNILNMYPLPNTNNGTTYLNYKENLNTTNNTFQWDTRMDWNISSKDQAFGRFSYSNMHQFMPSPLGATLDGYYGDGNDANIGENLAASETHIFNPNLINEFRFGYNYGNFTEKQFNPETNVSQTLGLGGIPFTPGQGGLVNVSPSGINGFGTPYYYPTLENEHVLEFLDNITKIVGNHALKFGVDFQWVNVSELQPVIATGAYNYTGEYTGIPGVNNTGSGVADFLANEQNSATTGVANYADDHRWVRSAYGQDDWRATPKLTVNIGLRYDFFGSKNNESGKQANFYPGQIGVGTGSGSFALPNSQQGVLPQQFLTLLAQNNVAVAYSGNPSLVDSQKLNFAPRLGFSYSVDNRTVVRAGFGIFYGGLEGFGYGVNLAQNVPFNYTSNIPAPGTCVPGDCPTDGILLETGFTQGGAANFISYPTITAIARNAQTPYSEQYNVSTEYAITNNMSATLGYVGGTGHHLYVEYPSLNSTHALAAPGVSLFQFESFQTLGGINYEQAIGNSIYNSLQAKLEKRYSNGVSFLASYTWSHSIDNAQSDLADNQDYGYRAPGILPIKDEMRNSAFDVRNRFAFNGNYQLPFGYGRKHLNRKGIADILAGGWSATLVFQAQTGNPFTIYSDISTANGLDNAPPIVTGDPGAGGGNAANNNGLPPGYTCPAKVRTPTQWYNPCAFVNPLPGSDITTPVTDPATVLKYAGGPLLAVYGPGYARVNMSVFKNFATFRNQTVQFRADVFNLLNSPWFAVPSYSNDSAYGGQITSTRPVANFTPDPRFFQLSLKYQF